MKRDDYGRFDLPYITKKLTGREPNHIDAMKMAFDIETTGSKFCRDLDAPGVRHENDISFLVKNKGQRLTNM